MHKSRQLSPATGTSKLEALRAHIKSRVTATRKILPPPAKPAVPR